MGNNKNILLRIDRLLSSIGYGTRKEVKQLIKNKNVYNKGVCIHSSSLKVNPEDITVLGKKVKYYENMTVLFNKPVGYTCSRKGVDSIFTLLPSDWIRRKPKLNSVGRLDKDSSGLLLLTDDGDFLHQIISPKKKVPKLYVVELEKKLNGTEKDLFLSGDLVIEKGKAPLKPVYLKKINDKCVELTLYEGKYHQIKKMFLKCHNKVVSLKRLKIGDLSINEIKTGDWKMLNQKDVDLIFRQSNEK